MWHEYGQHNRQFLLDFVHQNINYALCFWIGALEYGLEINILNEKGQTAEKLTIQLTLHCKMRELWLIRIFQVAIFDPSNHNSHSSLLHQCWWGYFQTNSLSRRNTGLTLCNNIKHCFLHYPWFSIHMQRSSNEAIDYALANTVR